MADNDSNSDRISLNQSSVQVAGERSSTQSEGSQISHHQEINLLDFLIILVKHKKITLGFPVLVASITAGIALLLPNIYTATAQILPPQQSQSSSAMMLGQLAGIAGVSSNALGIKNPSDIYVGMLNSRTVADNLIKRFKLRELFDADTLTDARRELDKVTTFYAGKDGIISISVDDEDPKRAADIANAYVDELYKLTQTLALTEASQRRLFFEKQLVQAKEGLVRAELSMKRTQEKTGVIALDAQGKAVIEAAATLRAQIATKEVELVAMRTFATEENPELQRTQKEIAGLRIQLARMEKSSNREEGDLLPATQNIPEAGLEYARALRDIKYFETVFELLARQLEMAKIDEARDTSTIQVLDAAVPPDKKSKPRRALIVLFAFFLGILAGIGLALFRNYVRSSELDPILSKKWAILRAHL